MKKQILFLCVANSARSQMAEGLANELLGDLCNVASAGSHPSGFVNPLAIAVLREIGINITHHTSKSWEDLPKDFVEKLDYVITLCREEACPVIPTRAKKLSWAMPDPKDLESFRKIRNEIQKKIEEFKP